MKKIHIGDVGFAKWGVSGYWDQERVLVRESLIGEPRKRMLERAMNKEPLPDGLVLAHIPWSGPTVELTHDQVDWESSGVGKEQEHVPARPRSGKKPAKPLPVAERFVTLLAEQEAKRTQLSALEILIDERDRDIAAKAAEVIGVLEEPMLGSYDCFDERNELRVCVYDVAKVDYEDARCVFCRKPSDRP